MIYSNTEFYYAIPDQIDDSNIILINEEAKHLHQVMRRTVGDIVYVTDGMGHIYESIISLISKSNVILKIQSKQTQNNKLQHIPFCIPILKSSDRFEFALEKCGELGITNFIIYSAKKSYKRGVKLERWEKILIAAMKQSLQSFKPNITFMDKLTFSKSGNTLNIIFDQLAEKSFSDILTDNEKSKNINFIFGPEGGLTQNEIVSFDNSKLLKLTDNRLRAETAVISAASLLSTISVKK
jgi:16S rRNA (uracil1498-N3)-methyltransferase